MEQIAQFWIPGRTIPKQRPRVTCNGTYYTQNYVDWMAIAIAEICYQKRMYGYQTPHVPVKVESQFINFRLGDCDNLEGACLDAMVKAEYLINDNSKYVVDNRGFFSARRKQKGKPSVIGCIIKVFEHPGIAQVSQEDWDFVVKFEEDGP